ncbi:MAG: GNAT family N-acetyltransferase [Planctomycetota bacterium]
MRVTIRELSEQDCIEELTSLLHRGYKQLADMGFNYTASYQDVATTRRRIGDNMCFVSEIDGIVVGTIVLCKSGDHPGHANAASITQFAVEPALQGNGIGHMLMQHCEDQARSDGFTELCLDTSEGAEHLIRFYRKRSYEVVDMHQWGGKTYMSVVMVKKL